jgi:hypothetical protein
MLIPLQHLHPLRIIPINNNRSMRLLESGCKLLIRSQTGFEYAKDRVYFGLFPRIL